MGYCRFSNEYVAGSHHRLGEVLAEAGRSREALGASLKALAIYEELARADPSSMENTAYIAEVRARIAALTARERSLSPKRTAPERTR